METPTIGPELRERLAEGYAAVAATSDERLRPELARVWGMEVSPDGRQLTFCVEEPARGVRFIREDALFSAVIDVEEIYDQTPGPAAGTRL